MPWLGLFSGFAILLFCIKKYKFLLYVFFVILGLVLVALIGFYTGIFTSLRLDQLDIGLDQRVVYWRDAVNNIYRRPFFGQGFLSHLFRTMRKDRLIKENTGKIIFGMIQSKNIHGIGGWQLHAHNMIFDFLINFGLVGTALVIRYFWGLFWKLFRSCGRKISNPVFALYMGMLTAIFMNGIMDVEIIGLQTIVFTFVILGACLVKTDSDIKKLIFVE